MAKHQTKRNPAERPPTKAELSQLVGMGWVLVRCLRKPTDPWWSIHHSVKPGEIGMEQIKAVIASPECYYFIPATSEEARGMVERMDSKNPGLRLTPIDGSPSHELDAPNTYRILNRGRIFAEVSGFKGVSNFMRRLQREAAQLATRATNVDALLDHHLDGSNPDAFVEFIRGKVLLWKSGRVPNPNSDGAWMVANGLMPGNEEYSAEPWLVDRCERWLSRSAKGKTDSPKDSELELERRFPSAADYGRFLRYLKEDELISDDLEWIGSEKSKLLGAYFGASNGLGGKVQTGDRTQATRTLKAAFKGWKLSNVSTASDSETYKRTKALYRSRFRNG